MPGHGQYHMIGKKRFYRQTAYWETLEMPGSPGDYQNLADFKFSGSPNTVTIGGWKSGSSYGIQVGAIYGNNASYLWGSPTGSPWETSDGLGMLPRYSSSNEIALGRAGNWAAYVLNKPGIVAIATGVITQPFYDNDFSSGDIIGWYTIANTTAAYNNLSNHRSTYIYASGGTGLRLWHRCPDGIRSDPCYIAKGINPENVDAYATLHGGFGSPIQSGYAGGYPGSPNDDSAWHGVRHFAKSAGNWNFLHVDPLCAVYPHQTSRLINSGTANRRHYISVDKTAMTNYSASAPRYPGLMYNSGYQTNWSNGFAADGWSEAGQPWTNPPPGSISSTSGSPSYVYKDFSYIQDQNLETLGSPTTAMVFQFYWGRGGPGRSARFLMRYQNTLNYLYVWHSNSGEMSFGQVVNGTDTVISSRGASGFGVRGASTSTLTIYGSTFAIDWGYTYLTASMSTFGNADNPNRYGWQGGNSYPGSVVWMTAHPFTHINYNKVFDRIL